MRKLVFVILSAMTLFITSCGKEEPIEKMIPAANVEIVGDDADAISVTGDVKVFMVPSDAYDDCWKMKVLVPLKNNEKLNSSGIDRLKLDVKDANYSILDHNYDGMVAEDNSIVLTMVKSEEGTTKNVVFKPEYYGSENYKKIVDYVNRTENITIELKLYYPKEDSYSYSSSSSSFSPSYASSSSSSSSSKKSSGSTNWDKLLDDYEAFVDKYIELYKKAMKGDNSAMTTYVEYLEKAENLADRLDDADDDMTTAQLTRYMKITNKMSEAAIELAGETSTYGAGW